MSDEKELDSKVVGVVTPVGEKPLLEIEAEIAETRKNAAVIVENHKGEQLARYQKEKPGSAGVPAETVEAVNEQVVPELTPEELAAERELAFENSVFGSLLKSMEILGFSEHVFNLFLNSKYYFFAKDLGPDQQRNAFILFINRFIVTHDAMEIHKHSEDPSKAAITHTRIRINLCMHEVPDDWLGAMVGIVLPYLKDFEKDYFKITDFTDLTEEQNAIARGAAV